MANLKKISYIIFTFCILPWSTCMVESAITAGTSKGKTAYAAADDKEQALSSSLLGSIYQRNRQSRCSTCYEDKRYGDDRSRYSSYASRSGDDRSRSWYYPSYDRYDDRGYRGAEYDRYPTPAADRYETDRYGGDRYSADRYGADRYGTADRYAGYRDDHYGARPYYDRYDSRTRTPYYRPATYDRGESRGYGYDNRDRYYGGDRGSSDYYGRDRYYERPRYGAAGTSAGYGGYDRDYYDRYSPRYDFRQYRPWDDTYRGQSEYDRPGHTDFYDKRSQGDHRYLPEPGYTSHAISPCGTRRPNCPHYPQEEGIRVTSGTLDSGHYNMGVSQTTYNTNPNTNRNESAKGHGATAGWSYMREDEQPSRPGSNSGSYASNSISNRQSSGYGALLDRGSNLVAVEPANPNAKENNNDSMATSDTQNDKNGDETPEQNDGEQNS